MTEQELLEKYPKLARVEKREPGSFRQVKSFVLRGQKLKDYQIKAVEDHLDDYAVFFSEEPLDFKALFGNGNPVVVEIGFGMGEATLQIAKDNPDINYLAVEVFLYGFTKVLARIHQEGLKNLKIMRFDATEVLQYMVVDNSVRGFHIFFPDPWPKKRHHNRRIVQVPFARLLASKLERGGYIYCVTDWREYAEEMLEVFASVPGLVNPYNGFADPVSWRPSTGFERKGIEAEREILEVYTEKGGLTCF